MSAATYEDVVELLGDVDELIIERVVATGATKAEIGEALDLVEDQRRFGDQGRIEATPRVLEVREILDDLLDEPLEEPEQVGSTA